MDAEIAITLKFQPRYAGADGVKTACNFSTQATSQPGESQKIITLTIGNTRVPNDLRLTSKANKQVFT